MDERDQEEEALLTHRTAPARPPVSASLPNDLELIPAQCSESAALSTLAHAPLLHRGDHPWAYPPTPS
jgi:hypothetical protein